MNKNNLNKNDNFNDDNYVIKANICTKLSK